MIFVLLNLPSQHIGPCCISYGIDIEITLGSLLEPINNEQCGKGFLVNQTMGAFDGVYSHAPQAPTEYD